MIWGLMVVAIGVGVGIWLMTRTAGSGRVETSPPVARRAELEEEHARLVEALRRDDLTDVDRAELELAAAQVLRDLDALPEETAEALTPPNDAAVAAPAGAASAPGNRRATWVGFAWGVAATLGVLALVYLAGGDSRLRREGEPITGGDSLRPEVEVPAGFEHPGGEVPEEAKAQLDDLERRWSEDQDLAALKELTLANLALERFMEAHRWSEVILEQDPGDPDGRYAQGVVRMAMGQSEAAVDLFDRVLADYPNHLLAMVAKGAALRGLGRTGEARATWEQALLVSGGQPQVQQLLDGLDQPAPQRSPATSEAPAHAEVDPASSYRVELNCSGARPEAGTLFVILRGPQSAAEGGPPVAVKRLDTPRLPATVALGQDDSMMGAQLPDEARLVARWDGDGNALTREELPEVEAAAAIGSTTALDVCP